MDTMYRNGIILLFGFLVVLVAGVVVSFFIGRAHSSIDGRVERELEAASAVIEQLRAEQQRTLDDLARSVGALENIRRITQETARDLRGIGTTHRRSEEISAAIAEEAHLLANYFSSVSGVLGDYSDSLGSE